MTLNYVIAASCIIVFAKLLSSSGHSFRHLDDLLNFVSGATLAAGCVAYGYLALRHRSRGAQ